MTLTVLETCSIVWSVFAETVTVSLIAGVGVGVGVDCCAETQIVKKLIKLNIFIIFISLLFRPSRKLVLCLNKRTRFSDLFRFGIWDCGLRIISNPKSEITNPKSNLQLRGQCRNFTKLPLRRLLFFNYEFQITNYEFKENVLIIRNLKARNSFNKWS
jgi:hypothetical protein